MIKFKVINEFSKKTAFLIKCRYLSHVFIAGGVVCIFLCAENLEHYFWDVLGPFLHHVKLLDKMFWNAFWIGLFTASLVFSHSVYLKKLVFTMSVNLNCHIPTAFLFLEWWTFRAKQYNIFPAVSLAFIWNWLLQFDVLILNFFDEHSVGENYFSGSWYSISGKIQWNKWIKLEPIRLTNFRDIVRAADFFQFSSCVGISQNLRFSLPEANSHLRSLRTTQHQAIFRTLKRLV